jgi:carbon-monoxide dehydrogenase large subunit
MAEGDGLIGRSVPRVEDERLLRGEGRYVDDLHPPGALEAAFLRSAHAHARIVSIDASAALALDGVEAVLGGAAVAARVDPMVFEIAERIPEPVVRTTAARSRVHPMPALAVDRVTYVGQPIAIVVAVDRYVAEDALELIDVELEPLPAVVDPEAALAPDAPLVEPAWEDNLAISFAFAKGDAEAAFRDAAVVVQERMRSHRYVASPIETRGVVAAVDPFDGALTVWSSTQVPFMVRDFLARSLGRDPSTVRAVATDVGGGFGLKGSIYPEELVVALAAIELGRPVKWIEDRAEHLAASTHGREQLHEIALAADGDGRLLGLRDRVLINGGAYNTLGIVVPYNTFTHLVGPYEIPAVDVEVRSVVTNTMITAPYRGAGRPEAVFAMERALDRLARALQLDPADLRARNLIAADAMPYATGLVYRDGTDQVYDSGDYPELFHRARVRAEEVRAAVGPDERRRIGVGYAAYVEGTGVGPFETARVRVEPDGRVRVFTGASSQGQSHRTTLAQIAADALGVAFADVEVLGGDSATLGQGFGTIASRTLVVAGNAIGEAAGVVRDRALALAADRLEAAVEDLELTDGVVRVKGSPDVGVRLGELAAFLSPFNPARPPGEPAELEASSVFRPGPVTYAAGVHAAVVAVDENTGVVEVLGYVVAHDCGRVVNPAVADGQITGGVMQGIGGALYEALVYGPDGQLRSGSFLDYTLPTASEAPPFVLEHVDVPTPLNPLGVKGLGEGGAIGPPAAIAGAVEDALADLGVVVRSCPLGPSQVRELIREAGAAPPDGRPAAGGRVQLNTVDSRA